MTFHWQLGTVADWVSGTGSLIAAIFAAVAISRDNATRKELRAQEAARENELRRRQASQVVVRPPQLYNRVEPQLRGLLSLHRVYLTHPVINTSTTAIRDVVVTVRLDTAHPALQVREHICTKETLLPLERMGYPDLSTGNIDLQTACTDAQETGLPPGDGHEMNATMVVEFTDTAGVRWRKAPGEAAREIPQPT